MLLNLSKGVLLCNLTFSCTNICLQYANTFQAVHPAGYIVSSTSGVQKERMQPDELFVCDLQVSGCERKHHASN